jgi:hypothetical protein
MTTYKLVTDDDLMRLGELRLAIESNRRARAASRNLIVQRQCSARIEEAQDELGTIETLIEMSERLGNEYTDEGEESLGLR